ncbi:hypothetical protein ACO0SA_002937 [Hanseniaspora valbyensis]
MLKFIDYNLNSDGKMSHELGGFSFELIKQLDMYNFIVKKFHKHFCLNIFDLDKKSKVELFCCDCKYKVLTQIPLNITENSSLPKHDCLTGTKLMNKKRSISAVVNNEADKLENEIEKKRQKRAVSEQIIGTEKQILNENEEKSYEKGNSENESDNQNKSNMIPKTFKLRNKDLAVGKESVKNNSTEKHQQSKAKLLIAKGKKKLQKNNSKRQMSIVDILQKGKQNRENKSLISHSSVIGELNLFKRSVSSQPLYLDEGFLSDDDEEEDGEEKEEVKEEIKEKETKMPATKQSIWDSDIKLSLDLDDLDDDEDEEEEDNKEKETKRKTEYIPLSPQNLKHVHDVTTNNDDYENVNRIISNVSVDFAKINDFKNVKQNTKSKSPTLGTEVPAKTPERLSEQFDIIESLKSPIAHRKIKSPISSRKGNSPINIHSNSPKRNPILDDKSEHDLRNISLRNASIHSPKTTIYNIITEDKIVQLFKKDDYEGILSISQINIDKLESNNIQIDSNVLFDDEEDEDESDNSENESVIINAVDDINHSNLIQTEKSPEKVQKDNVISDNPIESPNIKEVAVSNNTSANSSSKKHNLNELEKNKVLEPSVNIEKLENEDDKSSEHIFNGNSSLKEDISVDGNKKSEPLQKANEVVKLSANLDDDNYEHSEEKQRVPLENLQNSLKIPLLSAKEPEINVEFNLDFEKKKFNDSNNISQSQSVDAMLDVEVEEEDGENSEQRNTSKIEKIADIEERNLSDDNQEKEVEILETDSDNEMVQEEAVISSSNQHSIEQKAFKQQQISKSRNKALILNNISNAMDLAILSSPIISFYEKMLNFKTILETEKKEQQSIINAEYQERKNVLLKNHENLCSKIDNCNNLENLINLHKKLTKK